MRAEVTFCKEVETAAGAELGFVLARSSEVVGANGLVYSQWLRAASILQQM